MASPTTPTALALAGLAAVLAACAGGADAGVDTDAAARAWVGRPVSELLTAWGQPDLYQPLADGGEVVEYRPATAGDACSARFRVAADGRVAAAEGVGAGCGPER